MFFGFASRSAGMRAATSTLRPLRSQMLRRSSHGRALAQCAHMPNSKNTWPTSSVIKLCDDSSFLKAAGDEVLDSTPGVSIDTSEEE
jgi:hypothetical protein